jgi:hypothetical protein
MFDFNNAIKADPSGMSADEALDHLTALRKAKYDLEAADAKALDRLDGLADAGEIDREGFSHNDWGISWSAGKAAYDYPDDVKKLEGQLKAAREAAKAAGTAVKTNGNPFWTIKKPGS